MTRRRPMREREREIITQQLYGQSLSVINVRYTLHAKLSLSSTRTIKKIPEETIIASHSKT